MAVSHVVVRHDGVKPVDTTFHAWIHVFIRCIYYPHASYCCYCIYKALSGTASISARNFFLSRRRRGEEHSIKHTHAMGLSINYKIMKSL